MFNRHQNKVLAIIPARYQSVRFPGKPLVDIRGKAMVQRVYEQVSAASSVDKVIVATEDQRIIDKVQSFGGTAMLTSELHQSGTDRCGEVAGQMTDYGIVLNVQGDEPFVPPAMIDELIRFHQAQKYSIATLAKVITQGADLFDPNVVKVARGLQGQALYFSRHPIPFQRDMELNDWVKTGRFYQHVGIYIFNRETLLQLVQLAASPLEQQEKLEQLRWLENGYSIGVGITALESRGIDTPEDLKKII
jgi:3-deoxy-manno-octulosonate cytidylyltransferase (CMP-KDO synthetase)